MATATATKHTATIPAANFQQAVRLAASVALPRAQKAQHSDILLEIKEGTGRAHASDGEVGINAAIEGISCGQSFRVTTRAKSLMDAIGDSNSGDLSLALDDDKLIIRDSSGTYRLNTTNSDGFPEVNDGLDRATDLMLPMDLFEQAVDRTAFAIDSNSSRFALQGVAIDLKDGVRFVATDTSRLSVVTVQEEPLDADSPWLEANIVVPVKGLQVAKKLGGDEIQIAFGNTEIAFLSDAGTVVSRLIDGRFPAWRTVIPGQFNNDVSLVAGPVSRILRQASQFAGRNDKTDTASVTIRISDGNLSIFAEDSDTGGCDLSVPVGFDGNFLIRVNPKFLVDYFTRLGPTEAAMFSFIDRKTQLTFTVGEWLYLVMPLFIEGVDDADGN